MAEMSPQVFYRKWRPQSLSEIAGQEHVTRTLLQALATSRVSHAYLFSGPRGTGKTSTGRIMAKAVNCPTNGHGEPCNQCTVCEAITQGNSMDVVEIDAASNRGIDEIRSLREKVAFVPGTARYKVYIIDEVHMLTEPAANALLKTLEEPPAHVIFVLATTDPHKVPATILSRCQHFQFHRITQDAVAARLAFICEKEAIVAPREALRLIARNSTGSLRDAANLLEQTVAYYGSELTLEQVKELLGLTGDTRARDLARRILEKNIPAGLDAINQANSDGLDLRQFLRTLVNYLREILLLKAGAPEAVEATAEDVAEMKALAEAAFLDTILRAVKVFSQIDLRMDNYSTLPLEMALVESIIPEDTHAPAHGAEARTANRPQTAATPPARPAPRPAAARPSYPATQAKPPLSPGEADRERPVVQPAGAPRPAQAETHAPAQPEPRPVVQIKAETVVASNAAPPPVAREPAPATSSSLPKESHAGGSPGFMPGAAPCPPPPPPGTPPLDHLRQHWREFINSLRGEGSTGTLDALLRNACEPIDIQGEQVVLGFYWPLHKEKIEDPKYCYLVERKLNQFLAGTYKLRCVLTEKKRRGSTGPSTSSPRTEQAGPASLGSAPAPSTGMPRTEQVQPEQAAQTTEPSPRAEQAPRMEQAGGTPSTPGDPGLAGGKKSPNHLVEAALREGGRIISTEEK